MTRKPWFWLLLTICSVLCLIFSWRFFTLAFPTLDLSIQMSRSEAEKAARQRVAALQLAAPDTLSAVRFYQQNEVQNFIELEAGGADGLKKLITEQAFSIAQWEVRFYKEYDAAHTTLYYTPQGQAYGFKRHLPDQEAGAALTASAARQLAEQHTLRDWQIDLRPGQSKFALAEQSFQTLPNGRIDHYFSYERSDYRLGKQGEGRIRLTLRVAGNQLSEVRHSIKIPESFTRRYDEMRAANNTLAGAASLALGVLYGLGGCGLGLLILWRQHWILSRPAIIWAGLIAFLQCAATLNEIPGSWFDYDSAISTNNFITQQVGMALVSTVANWAMLSVSFMAAESLSRKAFGHLPQFWKLWSPDALHSKQVLGQTVGGYLWVGFDLAFIITFYYLTQRYLGWWSPLDTLIDPDVLATPLPWLPPLANALRAGFWEECLFRAVPLAGAALIGDFLQRRFQGRFGDRRHWLVITLILQALIFGSAHANYAQQPAFARPVELFLPSIIWGLVYLRYGLLPGILFHFLFDLLLMSLPIFITQAPGLALDRGIIIACALLPLALPLWRRFRAGQWQEIPRKLLNQSWQPTGVTAYPGNPSAADSGKGHTIKNNGNPAVWYWLIRVLPLLAGIGLFTWHFLPAPSPKPLPFSVSRINAENLADNALTQRGVRLGSNWHRLSHLSDGYGEGANFIWRQAGANAWQGLAGRYLTPPVWVVRYVRFDGDVVQRAQEWEIHVEDGVDGLGGLGGLGGVTPNRAHIRDIIHRLPESQAGAKLSEQQARTLAQQALAQRFGSTSAALREMSAQETKLSQRKDWHFTFADDAASPTGAARIALHIAGAEVASITRYIHITEEWQRQERARGALMQSVRMGLGLVLVMLILASLLYTLKQGIGKSSVPQRSQWPVILGLLLVLLLGHLNRWQQYAMQLKTDQALTGQLSMNILTLVIGSVLLAFLCASLSQINQIAVHDHKLGDPPAAATPWWPGLALAAVLLGVQSIFMYLVPPERAQIWSFSLLNNAVPAFAALSAGVLDVLLWGNLVAFSLSLLHNFNANFSRHQLPTILILLLVGLAIAMGQNDLSRFLLKGLGIGLLLATLYLTVARFKPMVLVMTWFGLILLGQLKQAWGAPYPEAWVYAGLHVGSLLLTARWWLKDQLK